MKPHENKIKIKEKKNIQIHSSMHHQGCIVGVWLGCGCRKKRDKEREKERKEKKRKDKKRKDRKESPMVNTTCVGEKGKRPTRPPLIYEKKFTKNLKKTLDKKFTSITSRK